MAESDDRELKSEYHAEGDGVAVRLSDEPGAMPVVPDLEGTYPHTNASLSGALRKPVGWVSKASAVLGLRERRAFSVAVRNSKGGMMLWRYTEKALRVLTERLAAEPQWDPFKAMSQNVAHGPT